VSPYRHPTKPWLSGAGRLSPSLRLERRRDLFGGTEGNEILTSAVAVVLIGLLVAEGVTVIHMGGLVTAHMFIGLVLIPPVLLKLASTGYRFVRYYTGSRAYRAKGPPALPLRVMAPVLVVTTLAVFTTGVLLLAAGHKEGALLEIHKVSFTSSCGLRCSVSTSLPTSRGWCAPYAPNGEPRDGTSCPAPACGRCW
jgi:hypothetical protein